MSKKKSPKAVGIYLIISLLQRKIYVGKTQNFARRKSTHKSELNAGKHKNEYLQRSWAKYGAHNFEIILWEECSQEFLSEKEKSYILSLGSMIPNGFNMTKGGDGGAMSREIIERTRLKNLGRKLSEETKMKISRSNLGRKLTPEQCQRMSDRQRGSANHSFGKPASPKSITAMAKHYTFTNPSGERVEIYNMNKFCRDNGLNLGRMIQVNKGREAQHKGWKKFYEQKS